MIHRHRFTLEWCYGHKEQARLTWVQMYLATGNAGLTCRRCGISRPTLRKWVGRFQTDGLDGLRELSRRPKTSPGRKILAEQEEWILELRRERRLGARRLQHELRRLHGFHLSLASIHQVLSSNKANVCDGPDTGELIVMSGRFRANESRSIRSRSLLVCTNTRPLTTAAVGS